MADKKKIVDLQINSNAEEVTDDLKGLNKQTNKVEKSATELNKESKKASKGVSGLGKAGKIASTGIKGIGVAMKAAGIGLIVSVLAGLASALSNNQKVMDGLSTAANAIQLTFKAVTSALSNAYKKVSEATNGFDAMKKVIKGLITIAITPLKLAFYEIKAALQAANLAYQKVFGDNKSVKEAQKDLIETAAAIKEVTDDAINAGKDVVNNFKEAVAETVAGASAVGNELSKISPSKILEVAESMTTLKNNAEIAAAVQAGMVEEFDRQAESLRQVRDEERNTIEDRIKANNELKEVLDNQRKSMLEQADLQIAAAQANVNANDTIENQVALIDALNNRKGVLAATEGFMSEQKVNDMALDKEAIELVNTKAEAENNLSIQKKRFLAEQITDEQARIEALRLILEEEKEIELERLENKINSYAEGTQAFVDAEIELNARKQEFFEQNTELNNKEKELSDKLLEDKKKNDELEVNSKKAVFQAVGSLMGVFGNLALKDSKAAKALAISGALINTYLGITEVWSKKGTSPFVAATMVEKIAATAAVAASGFGAVKGIKSTNVGSGGAGGGGGALSVSTTKLSEFQQSNFDAVGNETRRGENQAVQNANAQASTPVRAYVTSSDVATGEALERNRVDVSGF